MVILELNIDHFGKLKKRQISFRPGTNLISGNNETGKTTIAAFIKAMLYGLEEGEEEYLHFFPRSYEGVFGGRMKILENGLFYEIRRELSGPEKGLWVRELTNGCDVEDPEAFLKQCLGDLDRASFEDTGFLSTESFATDAARYRETEEKHREAKREEDIRNRFFNAREVLKAVRKEVEAGTDDSLGGERVLLDEISADTAKQAEDLRQELPGVKERLAECERSFREDEETVQKGNEERKETYRARMLDAKEKLSGHLRAVKKTAAGGRTVGIVLMVLGILAGLGAWFYMTSYGVGLTAFSHPNYPVSALLAGGGVLLFLAGLIVTIVTFTRLKAEEKRLQAQGEMNDEIDAAEQAYQDYLDHRSDYDDHVPEEAARTAEIEELKGTVTRLEADLAETEKTMESLRTESAKLSEREEHDRAVRQELRSLDLALATFDRVGRLNENDDYDEFSDAATEFYRALLPERPAVIHVKNETITVELKESGRHLLSQLSTGTMHETLIAVRLARLQELDPAKHLPLILDDVFSYFDETRLNAAMEYIRRTGRQVILFSCQPIKLKSEEKST